MQKVIIVDDEVHIRNLIKYLVHWQELEMELVGSFGNVHDVLNYFKDNTCDIVITDIQMPGMNGLEMIEEIKKNNNDINFVIVSGFRDFDFAKKAVKLNVKDYILKPIDEEELNVTLNGLKKKINSYENNNTRKGLINVLKGEKTLKDINQANTEYGFHFKEDGIFIVMELLFSKVNDDSNPNVASERIILRLKRAIENLCIEFESFNRNHNSDLILVQIEKENQKELNSRIELVYRQACRDEAQFETMNFYLSAGTAVNSISKLDYTTDSAIFFTGGRLIYGKQRVYIADVIDTNKELLETANPTIPNELIKKFERGIESLNENEINVVINECFDIFENIGRENPTVYLYICKTLYGSLLSIIQKIINISSSQINHLSEETELKLCNCDTIMSLRNMLSKRCIETVNQFLSSNKHNSQAYVQFAKDYINKHYSEDISLNDLADKAHINAAYLSAIFKESTGVNYITYLSNIRIEKAKELLRNLDMNMSQIADTVGYHNPRYFSRKFEEACGIKPSEYRRMYLKKMDW